MKGQEKKGGRKHNGERVERPSIDEEVHLGCASATERA